jgi:SAM-dependent methyltransferase
MVSTYMDVMVSKGLFSSKGNLRYHLQSLFRDIEVQGKRVLDIGGGVGFHSLYMAAAGAESVTLLEPEGSGSSANLQNRFLELRSLIGAGNVHFEPVTIQDFHHAGPLFDMVLLYNSINHLDEDAYVRLRENTASMQVYSAIFQKIFALSTGGAQLVVADCTRHNFFGLLSIRNPVARDINWSKHQPPQVIAGLLTQVGFRNPQISWTSFNRLRGFGRLFLANRIAAFFLTSHFRLVMQKPSAWENG